MSLQTGCCDVCGRPIDRYEPPAGGMTSGYYVGWYGIGLACDDCMWKDPRYVNDYGRHVMSWGFRFAALHDSALVEFDRQAEQACKGQQSHVEVFAGLRATLVSYLAVVKGSVYNNGVLVESNGHVGGDYGNVVLNISPVRLA